MSWWWLSFVDPDRPEGDQYLGAVLLKADDVAHALFCSHEKGLNPGGEIAMFEIPKEFEYRIEVNMNLTHRLLTREEAESFFNRRCAH